MSTPAEKRGPLNVSSRDAAYHLLNRRAIWCRSRGSAEIGFGLCHAPASALLRAAPPDRVEVLQRMQQEFVELFDLRSQPRSVMPSGDEHMALLRDLFAKRPGADVLLFEGFGVDSRSEGRLELERIAEAFRSSGRHVLLPSGQAADRWHDKRHFRREVVAIHGPEAVPRGESFDAPSPIALARFARRAFADGTERVIFKANGRGGQANLIVDRGRGPLHAIVRSFGKMQRLVREHRAPRPSWVSAERWQPWVMSGACSFFIPGERDTPVHMTLVQQIIGRRRAAYLGSRSFLDLSQRDRDRIVRWSRPLIRRMQADGLCGFAGHDWIASKPSGRHGELLLPDSRLAFRFVEATARMAAHNWELRSLSHLADREGRSIDDLVQLSAQNHPIRGATDRAGARDALRRALEGIAEPLSERPLRPGHPVFSLICNYREEGCGIADSVAFAGLRGPETEARILQAQRVLLGKGVLKS